MANDFTFRIARIFDAPLSLVWKAWADKDMAGKWFGPKGCTVTYSEFNMQSGGASRYRIDFSGIVMHGQWVHLDVVPQKKLVSLVSFTDDKGNIVAHPASPNWPKEVHSTVTFTEKDGKTALLVEWKAHNASDLEAKTFEDGKDGMTQGWGGSLELLEAFLKDKKQAA